MFTCFIKYIVDLNKLDEFKEYARTWISLVEKYGGIHHGFFLPGKDSDNLPSFSFSFPGIAEKGHDNIAVALFSFPSIKAYEKYKKEVAKDKKCRKITEHFNKTKCFLSYERNFLKPIFSKKK